jgi:hypothetical protein
MPFHIKDKHYTNYKHTTIQTLATSPHHTTQQQHLGPNTTNDKSIKANDSSTTTPQDSKNKVTKRPRKPGFSGKWEEIDSKDKMVLPLCPTT